MTIFIIMLILTATVLAWLATQSGEFHVFRQRIIKATPEALFNTVSDFKTWPDWTSWLAHEPDCKLDYSTSTDAEGSWYSWDGNIIGAGKMTHDKLTAPDRIEGRVGFTRPMSSESEVYWTFTPVDEGTEVIWGMRGKMPFFFRWMASKMDQWVGKDYEIGLINLAITVGDNSNPFKLGFEGIVETPAQHYISTAFTGTFAQLPKAMQKAFPSLMEAIETNQLKVAGEPLSIYHKVNPKKDFISCEMAIPVAETASIAGFSNGLLPARRYSRTTLHGEYTNLELAWYSAFSNLKMNKRKFNWRQPMLERYVSNPHTSDGEKLITYLDIPLK